MKNKIILFLLVMHVQSLYPTSMDIRVDNNTEYPWDKNEVRIVFTVEATNIARLTPVKEEMRFERGIYSFSKIILDLRIKIDSTAYNLTIHLDKTTRTPSRPYTEDGRQFQFHADWKLITKLAKLLEEIDSSIFPNTPSYPSSAHIIVESVETSRQFVNLYKILIEVIKQSYIEGSRKWPFVQAGGQPDALWIKDIQFDWYTWFKRNFYNIIMRKTNVKITKNTSPHLANEKLLGIDELLKINSKNIINGELQNVF